MLIISLPKLGHKITLSPHKAQHHLAYGQNSKKAQNSKSPTAMWLIPKPHYDVANSQKSHYDMANSKVPHYDVANSKVPLRCG